ncbi:RB1-inducible coiled-coil protein 1-like [Oppia nitens]|uniref:RB1-inducible coiled-coil protein 1-like n=1 Tax=Oppia nitens TaxID=1686743 RepID=UPI0023DA5D5C|nr:RB1-inducible coiled-coil protein 1-like [Oppia nitens]
MLYIFLVENGSMMTFDMNLALQNVANLKKAIEIQCQIPEDKQVLLISGGESLNPTARVCSYGCSGTDTSPIFLFSKSAIENVNPPPCITEYDPDVDMTDRVQSCIDMNPPSINTVVARAEMAQQLYEMAKQQYHNCEKLVHDQHLQQQGWAAVVANLEDIANSFTNSAQVLDDMFNRFIDEKPVYRELLQIFDEDIDTLSKIPLLSTLSNTRNTGQQHSINNNNDDDNDGEEQQQRQQQQLSSLLEWIGRKDNQNSLEQLKQHCCQGMDQFDSEELTKVKDEVADVLESCNQSSMKEVKGLEERLYGLEKLMCESKKCVDEQRDLAQAFYQNQTRAANLRDPSILPDLCSSHQQQLQVMLKNHQKLRDIRRRCARAKEELAGNLHARLRWIVFIEKRLGEVDSKVLIYRENIRRLKKHLEVVHQIHLTPKLYLASVVEVVRRKTFSDVFVRWASSLADSSSKLLENETRLRQSFSTQLDSHFLRVLFPGINDFPPYFATEAPQPFDQKLPQLTEADIEFLRQKLPELSDMLNVPLPVPMPEPSITNNNNSTLVSKPSESDTDDYETVNEEFDKPSPDDTDASTDVSIQVSIADTCFAELEDKMKNISQELDKKINENKELIENCDKLEEQLLLKDNSLQSFQKTTFNSISGLKDFKTSIYEQYCDLRCSYLSSFETMKQQLNDWLISKENEFNQKEVKLKNSLQENETTISGLRGCEQVLRDELDLLKTGIDDLHSDNHRLGEELTDKMREINELREEMVENKTSLTLEHELELTSMNEEMSKLIQTNQSLEDTINDKLNEVMAMKMNYEKLESELLTRSQEEKDSLKSSLIQDFNDRQEILKNEFQSQLKELEVKHESMVNELRQELDEQRLRCLNELKEKLDSEHKHEMDSLRHRFKLAISTTSIERTPSETSLEKVNLDVIDQLAQEREVMKLKQLIVDEKNRYEELLIRSKRERDDELKSIKSDLAAKYQVNFNEAVNKLSMEKDSIAQELLAKDTSLSASVAAINELLIKYNNSSLESSGSTGSDVKSHTQIVAEIMNQIENEIQTLTGSCFREKQLNESVICGDPRLLQCPCNSANMIKEKDYEINRLNRIINMKESEMTQSSTTSGIGRIERVSVIGCEVGDIVLIYYEEKFENYIVFNLNHVLHFLHTDCLDGLSLKSVTGEAHQQQQQQQQQQPQRWTIAEVTDKEYCQARKAQNRYKVPIQTKFYRIKAKPWSRLSQLMTRSMDSKSMIFRPTFAASSTTTTATNYNHHIMSSSVYSGSPTTNTATTTSSLPMSASVTIDIITAAASAAAADNSNTTNNANDK